MKRAAGIIMTGLFIVGITLMDVRQFAGSGSPETPGVSRRMCCRPE